MEKRREVSAYEQSKFSMRAIRLREKFSIRTFIYSVLLTVIFFVIYMISTLDSLMALSGFLSIIFGSIAILFLLIYLIFFILERMKIIPRREIKQKEKEVPQKKVAKKTTKKISKKKVSKKKK